MAGNKTIKFSAITRAGYEYQDLVGIEVLIRHYRDPTLFEWVQLESDDPSVKSLDDVVAKRMDGSVEYIQVKFTVNSAEYPLDWDYLLSKKENGTSMLAKWAKSFARAKASGVIHSAQLKTNRVPSSDFAACMNGTLVDLSKVPTATLALVEAECGGKLSAADFFSKFAFTASLPDWDRFETSLRDQLVPTDTDSAGWLLLRNEVTRWAILQREPPPDGKIQREHVVRLISKKRPRPIRQDFFVPEGYAPPNSAFDTVIRKRMADRATPMTVLWGTPGRGKSTYLSYLTNELQSKGDAVLRHHYFLTAEDSSANRASYTDIATSLYDQLFSRYPEFTAGVTDDTEKLGLGLGIAAENLARDGKRLYLIVDGLDHVYRDTHRTDQLNHLFNVLFPLPENLSLIVGTQRVVDDQLPAKLLLNTKDDDWIEIPRMDEVAVRRWLETQDRSRPIAVRWSDRRSKEIDKIGAALFRISQGHPLHLIYAFEGLVRSGEPLDEDSVLALPPCPDGDIRTYYKSLWIRIGEPSRAILHMLAGSDFFWPSSGLRQCIGEYGEIAFLLEPRNSGMMPFHGSIFAWVREREDHEESYKALLPKIVSWLEKDAPDYWRWGWLWLTQAESGNTSPLLTGATRAWAVDSLARGWPERQIQNILTVAESLTFAAYDLASTVRLRALKTRVSNVREYQAWDFGAFRGAALSVVDNRQQALNLLDTLEDLTNDELGALARHGPEALRKELVDGCYAELARRINIWIVLRHRPADDFSKLSSAFLGVAALAGAERVPRVMDFLKGYRKPESHILRYIDFLAQIHDIEALNAVQNSLSNAKWAWHRRKIQGHILRAALFVGADPLQRLKKGRFKHSPFVAGWFSCKAPTARYDFEIPPIPTNLLRDRSAPTDSIDLHAFFVDAFWIALRANKVSEGQFSSIYPGLERGSLGFIDSALDCLEECAANLAAGDMPWTFSTLFIGAADVPNITFIGRNETAQAHYLGFRKALTAIALDVHLAGLPDKNIVGIPADEFAIARASVHWVDEVWINSNAEDRIRYLSAEAAKDLLDDMTRDLAGKVSEFNERADQWTKYASLSHLYGVGDPGALMQRASSCLLGYGYRKDMFAFEVLHSIRDVHRTDPSETENWLTRVTPIVDRITDFTDGDGTRHARTELIDVVANTQPLLLPKFYVHHLDDDEWYYADRCLESFIANADISGPEVAALAGTFLDHGTLDELRKRAKTDDKAQALLERQTAFLGGFPPSTERDYSTPEGDLTDAEKETTYRDPTVFGPDDFAEVAKVVGAPQFHYKKKKEFLSRWLRHWHGKGKSRQAIAPIRAYFDSERKTYDVEELLDTIFEVSLEAEGKDAAYPWLVEAHIRRHGWSSYFTSDDEVEARLEAAARVYPDRWKDFIRDTSAPMEFYARRGYGFSIGFYRLVGFLLLAGQTDEAKRVTAEFVAIFEAETEDQPIVGATWLR
ncbi:NACHT domain-containing protein [Mesorhizobium sp.]|uniref:NACHT domain-containing protein n=3 Tax=Mesorhizobium sp. TaxID=1871066 RepID=UPI0025ECD549|nr:NACHT domain-containing protein [Mesorhizobium sp.]